MMNKTIFMERLGRFNVPVGTTLKYHEIYEKMARGAALERTEVEDRLSHISFVGWVTRGVVLLTSSSEIKTLKDRCSADLRSIPVLPETNLVNMKILRRFRSVDLKHIGTTQVYVEPNENGTPCLTMADVVSQLSADEVKKAKAFALCLKDDFAETGYLHLAKAYEYQIELYA